MPKLSDMLKETREITVDVAGETVTLVYRPQAMTSAQWQEWMSYDSSAKTRATEAAATRWTRSVLATMLVSWDVLRDDGTPWPTTDTPDGLQSVPSGFLPVVWSAIVADILPNPSGGGTSSAKSKRQDTPERRATRRKS